MDVGYSSQDEVLRDQQTTNAKAKLSDLTKTDLIELINHLEHEVHNRDSVISEMMNKQTRDVLYQSKYGRFGVSDPFTALQRDADKVTDDNFDHNQVKSLFDNQLQQLENLIDTQRRAQATMREQKLCADERYKRICIELEEAKRKHARDTAQGDDVTVALEKEREKLQQDLAYAKNQLKKCEKELKKTKSLLDQQTQLATKHKLVALDLIRERRRMVSKVAESEKRNQAIALLLQKEQEDNHKSENSKLLQLEARMEKQLMDFDIEREQYKTRLRKEESKVRDLLLQLTDIKETVLSLQQESNESVVAEAPSPGGSLSGSVVVSPPTNVTSVTLVKSLSQPVTVSHTAAPANNRALDASAHKVRLASGPISSPKRQPADGYRGQGQLRLGQPADQNIVKSKQTAPPTSPKPVSQAINRQRAETPVISANRTVRTEVGTRLQLPANMASTRQQNMSNIKQIGQSNKIVEDTSAGGTSIPTRATVRNVTANAQVGSKLQSASAPLVNKQSPLPMHITTNSPNIQASRSTPLSPRSVPPHLGAPPAGVDSKLVGTTTVNVANWRNTIASGPMSPSLDAKAGTPAAIATSAEKSSGSKSKPPPPVRNVSLPPSKKYHSIENTS